jgi:DNA-binding transcriptional ArsR family regulator
VITYDKALGALADPTRRRIWESLVRAERSVGAIASGLPVSRPAVSQHLRVLRAAGLVVERRRGTRRLYRAAADGLRPLRRYLDDHWDAVLGAFRDHAMEQGGKP